MHTTRPCTIISIVLLSASCARSDAGSGVVSYQWRPNPNTSLRVGQRVQEVEATLDLLPGYRFRQAYITRWLVDSVHTDTTLFWGIYRRQGDSVQFFVDSGRTLNARRPSATPMREWIGEGRIARDSFIDSPAHDVFPEGPPTVYLRVPALYWVFHRRPFPDD